MTEHDLQPEAAAAMFRALGDPTRLRIFQFLCACCCPVAVDEFGDVRPASGPTVGEVCCQVTGESHISSRISFHIRELRLAGLVTVERRGRNMICGVNWKAVEALAASLTDRAHEPGGRTDCC